MYLTEEYFMSSLTIEESNRDLWKIQLAYFAKREAELRIRSVNAALNYDIDERTNEEMVSANGWLNFAFSDANTPMKYTPSTGTYRVKINGRTYYLYYTNPAGSGFGLMPPASLRIACYGGTTQPIKLLIREMRDSFYQDRARKSLTAVFRPRYADGETYWTEISQRALRPMSTVVLDEAVKTNLLKDINDYLKNETKEW
jgi:hypothetical protein